jgi:hypothetical protein
MLSAGTTEQDVALSQVRAIAGLHHIPTWEAARQASLAFQAQRGFWLPLSIARSFFWLVVPDPVASKVLQMTLVVANLATACLVVSRIAKSQAVGILSGIGTLAALEFRKPHDAVLGATFGLPMTVELVLLAFLSYVTSLETSRSRWLAIALVLQLTACLFDDAAIPLSCMFLVYEVVTYRRISRAAIIVTLPILIVESFIVARFGVPSSLVWLSSPSKTGLSLFAKQAVASLPGSYRGFGNILRDGPTVYYADFRFQSVPEIDFLGKIVVLSTSIATYVILCDRALRTSRPRNWALITLGLLWILAGASLHESGQWIQGLPWGEAFGSVYIEYFGFGMLFAVLATIACSAQRLKSLWAVGPIVFALFVFAEIYGNSRVNERIVAFDQNKFETLRLLRLANQAGLFRNLPTGSIVTFSGDPPISLADPPGLDVFHSVLYSAAGNDYRVMGERKAERERTRRGIWVIRREYGGRFAGAITLAHGFTTRRGLRFDRAFLYRHDLSDENSDSSGSIDGIITSKLHVIGGNVVDEVRWICGVRSLAALYATDEPTVRYGKGFFRPAVYKRWNFWITNYLAPSALDSQDWRYAGYRSEIVVHGDRCRSTVLHFSAMAYSAAPGTLDVSARGYRERTPIGSAGVPINVTLAVLPGKEMLIHFLAHTPSAKEELGFPHFLSDERGPAKLVVAATRITVAGPSRQ